MKRLSLLFLLLLYPLMEVAAKIELSPLFSHGMVLQQCSEVKMWGLSDQKSLSIEASWGASTTVRVGDDGRWECRLSTPAGSFRQESLRLSDGKEEITLKDILIGEVWICSGQSNMYMTLRGYNGQPVEGAFEAALQSRLLANKVRMVTLPKEAAEEPQRTFEGRGWETPSPESVWRMSALAYYFAEALTLELELPIGIVSTSWGGSAIEAWMSSEDLREMGYEVEKINSNPKIEERRKCSLLYNGLIAPVEGYTARGFLWYQGESNRQTADRYAEQMERMVSFWREQWQAPEMPFYYVQIAPYCYKNSLDLDGVLLMEAQIDALERIPHSGLVATTDLGMEKCIHPTQKREVALRLAALALKESYGRKLPNEMCYPMQIQEVKYEQGEALVTLRNARWGLTPEGEEVLGFELAGEDGIFYPARAEIIKSKPQIKVVSPQVAEPVALRYAFRNYTPTNLHNTLGQPLLPYRSDR